MLNKTPIVATLYARLLIKCLLIIPYIQIPQNVRSRKSGLQIKESIVHKNQTTDKRINHLYQGAGQNPILSAISSIALEIHFSNMTHLALHPPDAASFAV
jgi:hypothetical protein